MSYFCNLIQNGRIRKLSACVKSIFRLPYINLLKKKTSYKFNKEDYFISVKSLDSKVKRKYRNRPCKFPQMFPRQFPLLSPFLQRLQESCSDADHMPFRKN